MLITIAPSTPVPTIGRNPQTIPTPTILNTPAPAAYTCDSAADDPTTQHTIVATLDYPKRTVTAQQSITHINRNGEALDTLALNSKPLLWGRMDALETLVIIYPAISGLGNQPMTYTSDGEQILLTLPEPLPTGCTIRLQATFKLDVPPIPEKGKAAFRGYFGYTHRQLNLAQWLLTVATRKEGVWITHPDSDLGEQDALEVADWDVTLTVSGAPANLTLAAPGLEIESAASSWHYHLKSGREFSMSLGENYQRLARQTSDGYTIELYSFEDARIPSNNGIVDTAAVAMSEAVKSVDTYTLLFGQPPHPRLVIVQSDFPDGMEFSGLVFVGGEYFRNFGGVQSYLTLITVHELAHQWWYGRVGSDQALYPWLDEALAIYCEYLFIEEYYPDLKDWWWEFRVTRYTPEGFVDSSVYDFRTRRAYINAVYLRGAQLLHELRGTLGDDVFFTWLRRYAEIASGRVVTPEVFWSLLTPEQFQQTVSIRERYFSQPNITIQPAH